MDAAQEASDADSKSSKDSSSDSDDDSIASQKKTPAGAIEGDVSDDEAKAILHRYQQQKVLEASQACFELLKALVKLELTLIGIDQFSYAPKMDLIKKTTAAEDEVKSTFFNRPRK